VEEPEWREGEGIAFAVARLDEGEAMPGLIAVDDRAAIGRVIEDLVLIDDCVSDGEIAGQVWFVPM